MIIALKLFVTSFSRLNKIKSRDIRRIKLENDTYSVLSIHIIRWVQVMLVLIITLALSSLTVFIMGEMEFDNFNDLVLFVFRPLINMEMMCYM